MNESQTAVLLINVGTPDSPSVKDVRKFLSSFLNDPRVIDLPWLLRKFLVNIIIVPFRAHISARKYKLLWTDKGSPLLYISERVTEKLQAELGSSYRIFMAMRYGNPDLSRVMSEISAHGFSKIIVIPLFPQYASSSSGTAIEAFLTRVRRWNIIPEITVISHFYNDPRFIRAFAERLRQYDYEAFDCIVFSYHGLPLRHIDAAHPGKCGLDCTCDRSFPSHREYCYRAECYETTRLIVSELGLKEEKYAVGFQSRLSDKWIKPFTDELIVEKAKAGIKKILIAAPSFVADCLETNVELGIEFRDLFLQSGGTQLTMVESLNDMPGWIEALKYMVEKVEN